MTTQGFEFSEGMDIEMWSLRRLPYIDRQTIEEKEARTRLSNALKQMPCDASQVMSATYTSICEGHFDIENILAYNIGMAAFSQIGQRGMCFERMWAEPPSPPSGRKFDHHHAYRLISPPLRPSRGVTLAVELPELDNVARVWWAVSGAVADGFAGRSRQPITGRFVLHVEVGMSGRKSLPGVLKKLVDGIVSGLQADPNPNAEAANRLAWSLSCATDDVVNHLSQPASPVLGNRGGLIKPFGNGVQWAPDDDRCEFLAVIVAGPPGRCIITVAEMGS